MATERVDVLAVMDTGRNWLAEAVRTHPHAAIALKRHDKARAAVAELIAAARLSCSTDRVTEGLREALDRVGGAQ